MNYLYTSTPPHLLRDLRDRRAFAQPAHRQVKLIPGRPLNASPDELRWLAKTIKDEMPQQLISDYLAALFR